MKDWLEHLFTDSVRENGWALALLIVLASISVTPMVIMSLRDRRKSRKKTKETNMNEDQPATTGTDVGATQPADEQDPQAQQRAAAMTELPGDEVQPLRGADIYRDLPTIDDEMVKRWEREGITDSGPITTPRLYGSASVPQPIVSQARVHCTHCEGRGYVPGVNDLLSESLALLGDQGDDVIRAFYSRLFMVAPELASLFPGNPTEGEFGTDHKGAVQRERLLAALAALAELYDPADAEKMGRLDGALDRFGRAHAAFVRQDGTIKGATWEEYAAVKDALFTTLVRTAAEAWRAEYTEAWSLAYDYAAAGMVSAQQRSGFSAPRFPRQG